MPIPGDLESPQGPRPEPTTLVWEYGPRAIGDLSEGLSDNLWRCYKGPTDILVQNVTLGAMPLALVPRANVDHVALTWDQQARPQIAFIDAGELYLYWYDPVVADFVQSLIGSASICFIHMPDRRQIQIDLGNTESVLAYQRGNSAYTRLQSDRFAVEYATPVADVEGLQLCNLAINKAFRLQMDYKVST